MKKKGSIVFLVMVSVAGSIGVGAETQTIQMTKRPQEETALTKVWLCGRKLPKDQK